MNKLTLEKIAQMSGVSRSTVSRVINNQPNVKPQVRDRVLQVVTETGYQPDPAARSLASSRTGIIGLVVPHSVQFLFTDPYIPRLIQGITQSCNTHNYTLTLFLFHTQEEEARLYPRLIRTQLFDGLILASAQLGNPLIEQMLENNVPFVTIGRTEGLNNTSFVDADNVVGSFTAINHLIRQGRERIATITGPLSTAAGIDRRQGYLEALTERGKSMNPNLIVEGDFTEAGGYACMQHLLPFKPDAVFAASDLMAFGAMRAMREKGLSVPQDIAIIGYDDLKAAAVSNPPLTTVRQPIFRMGMQAVEILLDLLNTGLTPPRRIIMPVELVIRVSCGG